MITVQNWQKTEGDTIRQVTYLIRRGINFENEHNKENYLFYKGFGGFLI